MKRAWSFQRAVAWAGLGVLVLLLSGCAQRYAITLNNGATLISRGKPRLERGYYLYRDEQGVEQRINELRVREIAAQ